MNQAQQYSLPEGAPLAPGLRSAMEAALAVGDYPGAIATLEQAWRENPAPALARTLLDLRIAAPREMRFAAPDRVWPPEADQRFGSDYGLAEIDAPALDPANLAAGVGNAGGLIVRGLLGEEQVAAMRQRIDRVLAARRAVMTEQAGAEDHHWYARSELVAGGPVQFGMQATQRFSDTGSVWAADSPPLALELIGLYQSLGLPALLAAHFGEPALLSVKKWVLRKVRPNPSEKAGWHQDGRFLGDGIRTVNMWIALSDCGGDAVAPGMDIVAERDKIIHETGTQGAVFDWTVGDALVEKIGEYAPPLNPRFKAGDALFFDQYNLHRTGFQPHHTQPRYALESWFFAASRAPAKQMPILF